MHAVIKTGGKQYRVKEGDFLKVETLPEEVGSNINFSKVLMLSDGEKIECGNPFVANAEVKGEIVSHGRHKKVKIIKFRRRKHHMKQMGHRQNYTEIKITSVALAKSTGKANAKSDKATKSTKTKGEE